MSLRKFTTVHTEYVVIPLVLFLRKIRDINHVLKIEIVE